MTVSGISPEALALPTGGSVHGLGGDFVADLNTGGGSYSIPLELPDGVEGHTPELALQYATGGGNGPFGFGWALPLPRVERMLEGGLPRYDETDRLTVTGAGPLVEVPGGGYVPETDGLGWRIRRDGDGFEATDRSGVRHLLGTDPATRVADPDHPARVFAWLLHSSTTPAGDVIGYDWRPDGAQRVLQAVTWAAYRVEFHYEDRPDRVRDGRAGFLLSTSRRCSRIELHLADHLAGGRPSLVRSWVLRYIPAQPTAYSLLSEVEYAGHGDAGEVVALPPLRLGYQTAGARTARLAPVAGAALLDQPQVTLADLSGDGLPDLLDLGGGRLSVARNRGGLAFDPPRPVDTRGVPGLDGPLFLADVAGRGRVDLCSVRHGLGYRFPVEGDATIGRPVVAAAGPSAQPGVDGVRLLDLDGDRRSDLVSLRGGLLTAVLAEGRGWRVEQRRAPAELAGVDTADPELLVAPLKGDGLPDLVRVRSGEVRWWPALGHGRWAQSRVMAGSPTLPARFRRDRLLLVDMDGDGCADLVYLDGDRVRVWCNRGGERFEPEITIGPVPGRLLTRVEPADLDGHGRAGLLLVSGAGPTVRVWYVTLAEEHPYLLSEVDNGLGEKVNIRYGSSVAEALRDRAAGRPWRTFLPFPVPVVVAQTRSVGAGAAPARTRYRYHDGAWDTALRRFLGFGRVETIEEGDESAAGAVTVTEFHGGRPPERADQPASPLEKLRAQARRGLVVSTRRHALGPEDQPAELLLRVEQDWQVEVTDRHGALTAQPRLVERREEHLDGAEEPWRTTVTRAYGWDEYGNIIDQEQQFERSDPDRGTAFEVVRTTTEYATDPDRWIVDRVARTVQVDGSGRLLDARIVHYDGPAFEGLPEGSVTLGRVTREERLALTDELVAEAYPDQPLNLVALGYHRREDLPGWWIHERRLERPADDPTRLISLDPRGNRLETRLDPDRLFPVERRDARRNVVTATRDPRAGRVATVDDGNGVARNRYDPLGRVVAEHSPGDSLSEPTVTHAYYVDRPVVTVETAEFPGDGRHDRITRATLLAGDLSEVGSAILDEDGSWVVADAVRRNHQGRPARSYLPYRLATGAAPQLPPAEAPHVAVTYDPMGRLLASIAPDGSRQGVEYGPGWARRQDEQGNVTTIHFDGRGNVAEVVAGSGVEAAVTRYRYDHRDELAEVTDATGRVTRLRHDLLGRRVRLEDPAAGVTTYLHDAAGNLVERRNGLGERTVHGYDVLNRRIATEYPDGSAGPVTYRYADLGDPPPGVRMERRIGRLYQVVDPLGVTTLDYDHRGEVEEKRVDLAGGGGSHRIGRRRDRLGRLVSVTYPATGPGEPARTRYRYDRRGLLIAVDGIVDAVRYDDAGLPSEIRYATGVATRVTRDPLGRVVHTVVTGPDGDALDDRRLDYDRAGNVVSASGPSPEDSWEYTLDALYQLRQATSAAGETIRYDYTTAGDVTFRSDLGECRYGEHGAPATCLTTAGGATFRYDAIGRLVENPAGRFRYDAANRLIGLSRDGVTVTVVPGALPGTWARTVAEGEQSRTVVQLDEGVELHDGQLVCSVNLGGRVVAQFTPGAALRVLHHDHRGSTVLVTGGHGEVRRRIRYDPWGRILADSADPATAGDGELPSFDGYRLLASFSLYLSPTRAYDPMLGRFTTPDPLIADLWHPVAQNRYAYAANNPVTVTDPSGLGWMHFLAALVLVAVVVLTVATFGAGLISLPAMIGVFAGIVVGGAVGGIAAYQKGGDILLGVLAGAAIGGAFALGGAVATAKLSPIAGKFLGKVIGGMISGAGGGLAASVGAATAGKLDDFWKNVWVGALYGIAFTVGAEALGAVIRHGSTFGTWLDQVSSWFDGYRWLTEPFPSWPAGAADPSLGIYLGYAKEFAKGTHKIVEKLGHGTHKKESHEGTKADELTTAAVTGTGVAVTLDLWDDLPGPRR